MELTKDIYSSTVDRLTHSIQCICTKCENTFHVKSAFISTTFILDSIYCQKITFKFHNLHIYVKKIV